MWRQLQDTGAWRFLINWVLSKISDDAVRAFRLAAEKIFNDVKRRRKDDQN